MVNLIIFDLDGVLIDTEHVHYNSLCDAINLVTGLSIEEIQNLIKIDGSTTKNKLSVLRTVYGFDVETTDEINRIKQLAVLKEFVHIKADNAQIEMLSALSMKYKLAVGSNSRKTSVDAIINALQIRQYFTHVISVDDIGLEKPNPAIFNYIMQQLDISPTNTLILEDSLRGIEAVRNSGAHLLEATTSTNLETIENAIRKIEANNSSSDGRIRIEIC